MAEQFDLLAPDLLPGLAYCAALIGEDEESRLVSVLQEVAVTPFQFHGWIGKRHTASFGWRYDFGDASFAPSQSFPDWLVPVRARAAHWAGLTVGELDQAIITRYDPGAGIGWHRDRPLFEDVIGLSLGAPAVLRLRRRTRTGFDRFALPIAPRSAYHLSGEVRHEWEHSIAPMTDLRWSITFRSLSDKGRIAGGLPAR